MSRNATTDDKPSLAVDRPRIEQSGPLRLAGLRGEFTSETRHEVPQLWQRFTPHVGSTPGQVGDVAYGVCFCGPGYQAFGYLAGVELAAEALLPSAWSEASFQAARYAVFTHGGHVSTLCETLDAIHRWLPGSGLQLARVAPGRAAFFERYGEAFCPETGVGGTEVWFPLAG